jgi:NADH-quinone oxidoreductase subunit C
MHPPRLKGEVSPLSSPAETSAAPAVEAKVDAKRDAMVAAIRTTLGAAVVDTLVKPGDDIWVRVTTESWCSSIQVLKDTHAFDYFCFLSAIDWMPSPYGRGEDDPSEPAPVRDTVIRPGYTGGDTRMQMLVRLVNSVTYLHSFCWCKLARARSSRNVWNWFYWSPRLAQHVFAG